MLLVLRFWDVWSGLVKPSDIDPKERLLTELQKLVLQYLPKNWSLVACGITTTIREILHANFVGIEVIVINDSMHCTKFLNRKLIGKSESQLLVMQVMQRVPHVDMGNVVRDS